MQRTLSREVRDEQGGTSQPQPARKDGGGSSLVQHWKVRSKTAVPDNVNILELAVTSL